MRKSITVVIPTIRDLSFLSAWENAFTECDLLIVEDRSSKTVKVPHRFFKSIQHYTWNDINQDFGNDEWIFSRQNAGIRSYGFWKAWKNKAQIIITLDDDCYPVGDPHEFVAKHVENLSFKAARKWFATYPDPRWMYTRGFPYSVRDIYSTKVSHGIWSGALDLDGKTELQLPKILQENPYPSLRQVIPFGYFYPMCSMNLAFDRDMAPLMFFPMMGKDPTGNPWGYDRFDDIWAGVFSKKIMDHLRFVVVNGSPQVEHRKASIVADNCNKEKTGLLVNEDLWEIVDAVKLTQTNPADAYRELIEKCDFQDHVYLNKLKQAIFIWLSYFA